jgi:TolB-like protein
VPASLDGTQPPLGFRQFQTLDLTGLKGRSKQARVKQLLDAIDDPMRPVAIHGSAKRSSRQLAIATAAALLLLVAGAWLYFAGVLSPPPAKASLAVLPFDAIPADDQNTPFAEGVSEEILGQLSRNPKLSLIGRASSETFRNSNASSKTIGAKLHVAYLLDGSVRRAGNRVKIAVELIRADDGLQLWRSNYGGSLDDIFAIQQHIGQEVEGQLRARFAGPKGVTASTLATRGDVYALYLTARGLVRDREVAKIDQAIVMLRKAVALDPNYAPAWASLSSAMLLRTVQAGQSVPLQESDAKLAKDYADRALSLAPGLAEAHHAKALVAGDPQITLRQLQLAAKLDPNDSEIWGHLAQTYEGGGNYPAALDAWRNAVRIDPLSPRNSYSAASIARALGYEDESRFYALRFARDSDPQPFWSFMSRAGMKDGEGDLSAALKYALMAKAVADPGHRVFANLEISGALRSAGYLEQARNFVHVDAMTWGLWHGQPPARMIEPESVEAPTGLILKTLVNHHRGAEVVAYYKRRFESAEAMVGPANDHEETLRDGATIALALAQTGHRDEANHLLDLLRREAAKRLAAGRVPRDYPALVATVEAAAGNRNRAVALLEQADRNKWFYGPALPDMADEPAYKLLAGDARFERVVAHQRAWQAKERREMAPLLKQLGRYE